MKYEFEKRGGNYPVTLASTKHIPSLVLFIIRRTFYLAKMSVYEEIYHIGKSQDYI